MSLMRKKNGKIINLLIKKFVILNVDILTIKEGDQNMEKRCNFELFKSNVCHRLKESGDIDFLIETLEKDMIREYYNRKWYLECFYLLAMVDYISREIGAPLCSEYDDLRQQRLQKLVYPAGVIVTANVLKNDQIKEEAVKNSIPEFLRHNIVESEVRNVI